MAKIVQLGLANTPAYDILTRPGHELWLQPLNPAQNAEQICRNVYWYGHHGANLWTWESGSGGNPTGEALARGAVASTNCGGFNLTARWIAHNVLNIPPLAFTGSYTLASDYFITTAGTVGIDRNWVGNVRTLTQRFDEVQAYFFMGHSYCKYAANLLDASTNVMNFHHKSDLYWCNLRRTFTSPTHGRAFRVIQRRAAPPIHGPEPYACVSHSCLMAHRQMFPIVWVGGGGPGVTQSFINQMPATTGVNWESMLLVSLSHLPVPFRTAVSLG